MFETCEVCGRLVTDGFCYACCLELGEDEYLALLDAITMCLIDEMLSVKLEKALVVGPVESKECPTCHTWSTKAACPTCIANIFG